MFGYHRFGVGLKAMMHGILSFPHFGMMNILTRTPAIPALKEHKPKPRKVKRRPSGTRNGWTAMYYGVAGPDSREAARRRRQGAHHLQRASHKPGTVQPRHIFGGGA